MSINRPMSHQREEMSRNIFESQLPVSWTKNPYRQDYGLDYIVTPFEDDKATGISFAVQLKGSQNVRVKDGMVSYPLETRHVRYYMECRVPVFLILIDLTRRRGYYCFLQQYVKDALVSTAWVKQKSVTIKIPTTQRIDDHAGLAEAVKDADARMAAIRPGAIEAAMAFEKNRLEARDPRIKVEIDNHVRLLPREPISGTFQLTGKPQAVLRAASDLIDFGKPISASERNIEIKVTGLPLFESDSFEEMRILRTVAGSARLISLDALERELGVLELSGEFAGGQRMMRMHATLPSEVLAVDIEFHVAPNAIKWSMQLSFANWYDKDLRFLEDFDRLRNLFPAAADVQRLRAEVYVAGNRVAGGDIVAGDDCLASTRMCFDFLAKARTIAERTATRLTVPSKMNREWANQVEALYRLAIGEPVALKAEPAYITVQVTKAEFDQIRQAEQAGPARFELEEYHEQLNGTRVNFGRAVMFSDGAHVTILSVEDDPDKSGHLLVKYKIVPNDKWALQCSKFVQIP